MTNLFTSGTIQVKLGGRKKSRKIYIKIQKKSLKKKEQRRTKNWKKKENGKKQVEMGRNRKNLKETGRNEMKQGKTGRNWSHRKRQQ